MKPPSFRARLFFLAGIVALLAGGYWTVRYYFYRKILLSLAQNLLNEIATARVERLDGVELDPHGNLVLRNAEVFTYRDGVRRLFYRAPRMKLTIDGIPGRDRNVRIARVDLIDPEIFIRRERNGVWNVEWALRSSKPPPPPTAPKAPASPTSPPEDPFPREGIHIVGGTIHITTVGKSGREVTWTIGSVQAILARENGILALRPCEGEFYGGRLNAKAELPSVAPFRCDFQITVTGASVEKLAERLALKRPVTGTLDGVLALKRGPERTNSHPIAAGRIEIAQGDLWELPVFFNILSILALDPGLHRTIDSAEVQFTVEEDRIRIDQMDFVGDPLCLFGDGRMDLTGENLEVVFVPRLGKHGMGAIIPILGTPIQWVLDVVKGVLIPVVMTGSFDHPEVAVMPFHPIAAPVKKLVESRGAK